MARLYGVKDMNKNEALKAAKRISPYIARTPLVSSQTLSQRTGKKVWLKLETEQPTGAFKVRAAFNGILSNLDEARKRRTHYLFRKLCPSRGICRSKARRESDDCDDHRHRSDQTRKNARPGWRGRFLRNHIRKPIRNRGAPAKRARSSGATRF